MATEITLDRHIEITPGVVGGKPRIAGHRITVQNIVIWHELMGLSADEIAAEYGIPLSGVYAALAYYYDHHTEIDESIRTKEWTMPALVTSISRPRLVTSYVDSCLIYQVLEPKDMRNHVEFL